MSLATFCRLLHGLQALGGIRATPVTRGAAAQHPIARVEQVRCEAGFRAHSLALLSDAGHNFTDGLALLLAWFGFYLQSKPANEIKTFVDGRETDLLEW